MSIFILALAGMPAVGLAEEHGGAGAAKEHGGTATPAGTAEQAGAATAPTAPTPTTAPAPAAPPALKPITITFSGDVAALDGSATPPMITVQDRYGVKKEIACPGECKIAQGAAAKTWADLKVGDKVTVEYTYDVATGKRAAQSINLGEAAPAATGQ
ncbi:MAG: hypothetical protein HYZ90_03695 [Candidatus Omnitrophica bacterium]|nr:hypothetical protein [Candidatus Omnitrophota bacterium]